MIFFLLNNQTKQIVSMAQAHFFLRHSSKHRIVSANRWSILVVLRFRVAHLIKVRLEILE